MIDLACSHIEKAFGPTRALAGVSLQVRPGEIHALVGENGSGKSTLMNVFAGVHAPDGGTMALAGEPYRPRGPEDARRAGVGMIHQELALCPDLTVAENIVLGLEPARLGWVRRDVARRTAREALAGLGHADLEPDTRLGDLSIALRQVVEIARATASGCGVLLFDEPTSSLAEADAERLFAVLGRLRAEGRAILYVSHFLEEVGRIADRVTVLRDGEVVGERVGAESSLVLGPWPLEGGSEAGGPSGSSLVLGPSSLEGEDEAGGPSGSSLVLGPSSLEGEDEAEGPSGSSLVLGPSSLEGEDEAGGPSGSSLVLGPSSLEGEDEAGGSSGSSLVLGPSSLEGEDEAGGPSGSSLVLGPSSLEGEDEAGGPSGSSLVLGPSSLEGGTECGDPSPGAERPGGGQGGGAAFDASELVALMAGRAVDEQYPRSPRTPGETVLAIEDLAGVRLPRSASLELRRGEVLGIAGLHGSGRTELLRAVFGLDPVKRGAVRVGLHAGPGSPVRRWAQGVGLLSEDRKEEGLALGMSLAENLALSDLPVLLTPGSLERKAEPWLDEAGVRRRHAGQAVRELSGGNQQKIAFARLLFHGADVLLLDEPTRGIDVASKHRLYELIDRAACDGRAVVVASSYLPELFGICDRIAVMHRGDLGAPQPTEQWTPDQVLKEATGS